VTGLWFALVGCVVALDETVTITVPVDHIVIDVAAGDVRVHAGPVDGPVKLMGAFGGAGGGPLGHELQDGLLTVRYDCRFCGGELTVEAPPDVSLSVTLGAGDITIDDMSGALDAVLAAGSAEIRGHGPAPVDLELDLGDVRVDLVEPSPSVRVQLSKGDVEVALPDGAYDLDLDVGTGSIRKEGVNNDPESPNLVYIAVDTGSIDVHPR
jgi:hypothetical protein